MITAKNISHYHNYFEPERDDQSYVGAYNTWSLNFTKINRDNPDIQVSLYLSEMVAEMEVNLAFEAGYRKLNKVLDFQVSHWNGTVMRNFSNYNNYL